MKIKLGVALELECDEEIPDHVRKQIELSAAVVSERLEALVIEHVQPRLPNVKFIVGPGWRGMERLMSYCHYNPSDPLEHTAVKISERYQASVVLLVMHPGKKAEIIGCRKKGQTTEALLREALRQIETGETENGTGFSATDN